MSRHRNYASRGNSRINERNTQSRCHHDAPHEGVRVAGTGLEGLTAGAAFWRGAQPAAEAEAEWLAQRPSLTADWKAKRRAALKHAPRRGGGGKRGRRGAG